MRNRKNASQLKIARRRIRRVSTEDQAAEGVASMLRRPDRRVLRRNGLRGVEGSSAMPARAPKACNDPEWRRSSRRSRRQHRSRRRAEARPPHPVDARPRRPVELFAKADAALVSVSENLDTASACGRLVLNVMGSVAQWEREAIAERTSTALAHKRQRGQVYGATPFGYSRVGDALVPEPREQVALEEAAQMDRAGASFREIAARLTEIGVIRIAAKHGTIERARHPPVQDGSGGSGISLKSPGWRGSSPLTKTTGVAISAALFL